MCARPYSAEQLFTWALKSSVGIPDHRRSPETYLVLRQRLSDVQVNKNREHSQVASQILQRTTPREVIKSS
jgi:hypothetical protein